jgi:hypothetical protein
MRNGGRFLIFADWFPRTRRRFRGELPFAIGPRRANLRAVAKRRKAQVNPWNGAAG